MSDGYVDAEPDEPLTLTCNACGGKFDGVGRVRQHPERGLIFEVDDAAISQHLEDKHPGDDSPIGFGYERTDLPE